MGGTSSDAFSAADAVFADLGKGELGVLFFRKVEFSQGAGGADGGTHIAFPVAEAAAQIKRNRTVAAVGGADDILRTILDTDQTGGAFIGKPVQISCARR